MDPTTVFKVVFIGDSDVGKSCLLRRYTENEYNSLSCTTIGVDYQIKSVVLDGAKTILQLWDTAGQEKFRSVTKQYFRKADGIVIVYDISNKQSFLNVRNWIEYLNEVNTDVSVIMLLANKIDLLDNCPETSDYISSEVGERLKAATNVNLFHEVSAKSGKNVEAAFDEFARSLKKIEEENMQNAINLEETSSKKMKKPCCK